MKPCQKLDAEENPNKVKCASAKDQVVKWWENKIVNVIY
jgi:hypothetical protein